MQNKSDAQLRRILKDWASRPSFPIHLREKIMIKAAALSRNRIYLNNISSRPQFSSYPLTYSNDWTQTTFTWMNMNSFQREFQVRLGEYAF